MDALPAEEPHDLGFEALGNLLERVAAADVSELRRWLDRLPDNAYNLKRLIVVRWATLDPAGAIAALRADPRHHSQLDTVLGVWAQVDLGAALDAQVELISLRPYSAFWSSLDPGEMGRLCTLMEDRNLPVTHPELFRQILPRLAETEPERAAALALKGDPTANPYGDNGMMDVLGVWTRSDPEAALRWAKAQDNPELLGVCAAKWLESDPLAALKAHGDDFTLKFPPTIPAGNMTGPEFTELMRWMAENGAGRADADYLYEGMLRGLNQQENAERFALIAPLLGATQSSDTFRNAATAWAARDTDGLLAYINDSGDGPARDGAIAGLCEHLAKTDARRALDFLAGLETIPSAIDFMGLVSNALEQGNRYADVLRGLPDNLRAVNLGSLVVHLNEIDFVSDIVDGLDLIPDEKKRDSSRVRLAGVWARQDPEAAAAWVRDLDASETRDLAAGNLARFWAMTDPAAAVAWAHSLDDPASRSRALHGAADYLAKIDPGQALELAAGITDADLRGKVQATAIETLARQDPDRAQSMLEATETSDASRVKLLGRIEETRALRAYLGSAP